MLNGLRSDVPKDLCNDYFFPFVMANVICLQIPFLSTVDVLHLCILFQRQLPSLPCANGPSSWPLSAGRRDSTRQPTPRSSTFSGWSFSRNNWLLLVTAGLFHRSKELWALATKWSVYQHPDAEPSKVTLNLDILVQSLLVSSRAVTCSFLEWVVHCVFLRFTSISSIEDFGGCKKMI